jgi:hypothetical protein
LKSSKLKHRSRKADISFLISDFLIKIWMISSIEWEMVILETQTKQNPNKTKHNKTGKKCRSLIWFFTPPEPVFCHKKNLDKWFLKPLSSTDKSPLILHGSIIPVSSFNFFYLNLEKVELFGEIIFSKQAFCFCKETCFKSDRWYFRFLCL